jgi:hypothetical protein
MAFDAVFEVFPDVKIGDLSGAEVEKVDAQVTDAAIDKTIDIKEITNAGPNNVSEVKIFEFCQDTKPSATVTALSMIDACTAANSCLAIKP